MQREKAFLCPGKLQKDNSVYFYMATPTQNVTTCSTQE